MNIQSNLFREVTIDTIKKIFQSLLQEEVVWEAQLLDGGMFNTTYLVVYGLKHKKAVLRFGPVNRHLIMGFEENLMKAEAYVYSVCQEIGIPCSHVLAYDTSKCIVDRDFMIVEYIPSIVMSNAELSEKQREYLYFQMGKYLWKLHQVTGENFGFVSHIQDGKYFEKWSEALIFEVEDITKRLENLGGLKQQQLNDLREIFYQNREVLDEIRVPYLLHTDLWEGNVLLDKKSLEIIAIIDSDRAVFGDPDFEFSSPWMRNPFLLKGYGLEIQNHISENRKKRRQLYQVFFLLLEAYVGFAEYNNPEQYRINKKQLLDILTIFGR